MNTICDQLAESSSSTPVKVAPGRRQTSPKGLSRRRLITIIRISYPQQIQKARHEFEREFIREALRLCNYNISCTARTIGMARRNLQYLLQRLRINVEQMKQRRE